MDTSSTITSVMAKPCRNLISSAQPRSGQSLIFNYAGVELSPGISADYLHFEIESPDDMLGHEDVWPQGSQKTETLVTLKSLARTPG